jgi:hypothetical protein
MASPFHECPADSGKLNEHFRPDHKGGLVQNGILTNSLEANDYQALMNCQG